MRPDQEELWDYVDIVLLAILVVLEQLGVQVLLDVQVLPVIPEGLVVQVQLDGLGLLVLLDGLEILDPEVQEVTLDQPVGLVVQDVLVGLEHLVQLGGLVIQDIQVVLDIQGQLEKQVQWDPPDLQPIQGLRDVLDPLVHVEYLVQMVYRVFEVHMAQLDKEV